MSLIGMMEMNIKELAMTAKKASKSIASAGTKKKNEALLAICNSLLANTDYILGQNKIDIEKARQKGTSDAMIDRLTLTSDRIKQMSDGVKKVIDLDDPIGDTVYARTLANGLKVSKVTGPMGVIGVIYESRPNVTLDTACLCLKASSAVILRGGSDAFNSNKAIADIMKKAVSSAGIDADCIAFVEDTSRETATELMKLNGIVDLLIPRGGASLIQSVVHNATVPVIETGVGNCHIFVDESADIQMAIQIIVNAKTSRPSVCNACESLLVHKDIGKEFYRELYRALKDKNVEIRGCEATCKLMDCDSVATDEDFDTEYLDYIISVKTVESIDDAIAHIEKYSTGHSECIITESYKNAMRFTNEVDSAAVYVNASTRFTDGFEFGLGAEIGISTQKLHARGPMGLREITTTKYIITGNGQIRG